MKTLEVSSIEQSRLPVSDSASSLPRTVSFHGINIKLPGQNVLHEFGKQAS